MCINCEALMINGVLCHETGCPDAWRDYPRECDFCGGEFVPESRWQNCCSDTCYAAYLGD